MLGGSGDTIVVGGVSDKLVKRPISKDIPIGGSHSAIVFLSQPFPGYAEATLPGGPEWKRERQYAAAGIPLSAAIAASLQKVAAEFGLAPPW